MMITIDGQARLTRERQTAINRINQLADSVRRMFITPIIGQEMVYLEKESEARVYLALDPEPVDLSGFPFIAAEVGVTAATPQQVAQLYLNLGAQWRVVGSMLENVRLGSIAAIEAATTLAQISAAVDAAAAAVGQFQP
ncbi:hypothetical protein [Acidiphilium sp.]|uniref:hypothetical protein n=1 Tax=Acidiphilium sp. TaxID=527 RepID=UPI002582AFF0|nr:hypothetical protein [Acidiphilium sp.]